MTLDLPKSYDAKAHETDVYQRWESSGCFKAGAGAKPGKPTYTIAIPPPNVTGVLHMGHALNNTLQDTLIRWKRMQGFDTLWQPGTDHAGIATESVVAKQLIEEGQTTREKIGRDAFIARVWQWKEQSGGSIVKQLRKLGSSCDWSRERFTMDDGLSRAVRTQFKNLYDAKLIYRGTRMVNWSPVLRTALSDDEVDYVEKQGFLWKLRYDLVEPAPATGNAEHDAATGGGRYIIVETTRPETFFGDTAVAVNGSDERYRHLIGKKVRLPIIGREIPIIADDHADPTKGSGAVKITPAHDPNDYAVGQRHGLPLVRCIGFDGVMTAEAGPYAGQDRFACRKQLLKDLAASGVLLGETEIKHSVGHSERTKEPIEPMVTEQWFVRMAPLAERALAATRDGRVVFHPERWTKVYCQWLENVRDWCISRQIWWGHRIPAWHCADCAETTVAIEPPTACAHCQSTRITQDADVLDTWFSSALWPFSTLGWPDRSDPALQRYFPTSTLVTDRGIIYFWVARMVMGSLFALDREPFKDVYIHGTVLDERGVKMSKSLGNGIDPLVMIEGGSQVYLKKTYDCPGYGADAVRFTLLDMTTEGQDLKLSPAKFETGRNFANKVWNAGRFLLMNLSERPLPRAATVQDLRPDELGFVERWLLDRLQGAIDECSDALERFRFSDYANAAYRFFRDDLCDWYVEWAKHQFKAGGPAAQTAGTVLWYAFDRVLRLLHPGMPFISEYLWQQLLATAGGKPWAKDRWKHASIINPEVGILEGAETERAHLELKKEWADFLMLATWPEAVPSLRLAGVAAKMAEVQAVITGFRNVWNLMGIKDAQGAAMYGNVEVRPDNDSHRKLFEANLPFITELARLANVVVVSPGWTSNAAYVPWVVGTNKINVIMDQAVDLGGFIARLEPKIPALAKSIAAKEGRLANPDYAARAPAEQVAETRRMLGEEQDELQNLTEVLRHLQSQGFSRNTKG